MHDLVDAQNFSFQGLAGLSVLVSMSVLLTIKILYFYLTESKGQITTPDDKF